VTGAIVARNINFDNFKHSQTTTAWTVATQLFALMKTAFLGIFGADPHNTLKV